MRRLFALVIVGMASAAGPAAAATITVAPGSSPAGGYLPLSLFGIPPIAGVGDETFTNFVVPSFTYAGQSWNNLGVVSNGYVVVGGATAADVSPVNTAFPNPAPPNNVLAPYWTDLDPSLAGAVRIGTLTDGSDTWIVVDWQGVRNKSDANTHSFQIWIGIDADAHPGEDISFAYGPNGAPNLGFLSVGAEDVTGTVGGTYYFNGIGGPVPGNGTQVRVTTSGLPVVPGPVPEPATLAVFGALACVGGLAARRRKAVAAV